MSVWSETTGMAERHPYWVAGGFVAIVLLIVLMRGGTSTKPQNFTFSYGPSDAQVLAGTQLAIAQAGDQSAITAATIQADTTTQVAHDYFSYLTGNSANQLTEVTGAQAVQNNQINAAAQVANNQIATAGNVAIGAQGVQLKTGLASIAAQLQAILGGQSADVQKAQIAGQTATNQAYYANQTATKTAEFNADASMYASGAQAYATTFSTIMAGQMTDIQKAAAGIN